MADVTLPNMGLVQPSLGGSNGTWGTSINNNIGALDAHDHSAAKGVQVPVAGLDIDDDLSFAGLHGPIHCFRVGFDEIAGVSIPARSFYVKSSDHELYFKSTGLADIKLTSGGDLNLSGTGGFIGDYAGAGAKASFDTALNEFKFTSSANLRSQIQCGGVKLVERDANESFGVTLQCPAALAAGYAVTLPVAPPTTTTVLTMSGTGVIGTSTTWQHSIAQALPTSATLTPGSAGLPSSPRLPLGTTTDENDLPLTFPVGGQITGWSIRLFKGSAAGTVTAKLWEAVPATGAGTPTQIGTTKTNSANNPGDISLGETGLTFTTTVGRQYYITVNGGGTAGDILHSYYVTVG